MNYMYKIMMSVADSMLCFLDNAYKGCILKFLTKIVYYKHTSEKNHTDRKYMK